MGRPPKTSAERILEVAEGMNPRDLQMTSLAIALGISVKTVYYYFPTRAALLDALTDRAVREMGLPDLASCGTWQQVLSELAGWSFRIGRDHPGWSNDTAGHRGVGMQVAQRALAVLSGLGWTPVDALLAQSIVGNWALMAGQAARNQLEAHEADPRIDAIALQDAVQPGDRVELQDALARITADQLYETGLAVLLAGLGTQLPSASA